MNKSVGLWLVMLALSARAFAADTHGCLSERSAALALDSEGVPIKKFQEPLDGRKYFDLEIHEYRDDQKRPHLYYLAARRNFFFWRKVLAIDPTILTQAGGTLHFTLRDCLKTGADVAALQTLLALKADKPPNDPTPNADGVAMIFAEHPTPLGDANIHTHGLHAPPTIGGPGRPTGDEVLETMLETVGQTSMEHQGNSARYAIHTPADQHPGLYWYHPHFHGEAQQQVYMGLSGAIVVLPENARTRQYRSEASEQNNFHTVLVARDWPLSADPPLPKHRAPTVQGFLQACDVMPKGICTVATSDPAYDNNETRLDPKTRLTLNGHAVLRSAADYTSSPLPHGPSSPARIWRVLNSSANTYMAVGLGRSTPGKDVTQSPITVPMRIVARDGEAASREAHGSPADASVVQKRSADGTVKPVLVPPGGRLEFQIPDVELGKGPIFVVSAKVYTGKDGDGVPWRTLFRIDDAAQDKSAQGFSGDRPELIPSRRFTSPDPSLLAPIKKRDIIFLEATDVTPDSSGTYKLANFYIKALDPDTPAATVTIKPFDMASDVASPSVDVVLDPKTGVTYEQWSVYNFTGELHAFHIHQLHFSVLSSQSGPRLNSVDDLTPELEDDLGGPIDVVNVPFARQTSSGLIPGKVVLLIPFNADIRGEFVFHCHLLEHEDGGMMGTVRVRYPDEPVLSSPTAKPVHH